MAVFDLAQQRVCVRVVYDGAASAGKTTNLRQLAELFATQRTCELFSPAEIDGRTLYFDWLEIAAGMVCGFPLVCQAITVPGQMALTPRRRHLLQTADVVVHVSDSSEQALARVRDGLALFDDVERDRGSPLPLVVQANKQDQAGARPGIELQAALARASVPVVEAIASDGIGVVDTFVAAVRAAVRSIQAHVEGGDHRIAVQHAESAETVLEKLAAEAVDPEWAVEKWLEQVSNAFALGIEGEHSGGATPEPPEPPGASDEEPPTWRPGRAEARLATLPTEHVPMGFVWPAHTGRAALRALAGDGQMTVPAALDLDGTVRAAIGDFVLSTGMARRFDTPESARQALVRAARERTQLGPLLAPETVLVVQPGLDDASWLWTILPRMPTVAELVQERAVGEQSRGKLLAALGAAMADALRLQALHGIELDLSSRSFGVRLGAVRYLGEVVGAEPAARDIGRALFEALDDLAVIDPDLDPLVTALESAIAEKLSAEDLAKLDRAATWHDVPEASPVVREACSRLVQAFHGSGQAA